MMLLKKEREIEGRLGGTVEFRCGGDVTLADQGRHRKFPWAADKPIHMSQREGSMDAAYLSYLMHKFLHHNGLVSSDDNFLCHIGKKR